VSSSVSVEGESAPVVAAVPEPGSITCVALVGMALLGRRRARRVTR
jgi:hypothetical protein